MMSDELDFKLIKRVHMHQLVWFIYVLDIIVINYII
jgi:hypothetical protein